MLVQGNLTSGPSMSNSVTGLHIEGVTVSVGYADFLAETLPLNLPIFDRLVVVTTPGDSETQALCHRLSVPCVLTDEFYRDGAAFNKGRGIVKGLDNLAATDWLIHLDADIVLPPTTRQILTRAHLDPKNIYGIDRVMVQSWDEWQALKTSNFQQHDYHFRVNFPPHPVGTRWSSPQHGYVPIGFFQMWHGTASINVGRYLRPYPVHHNDAARSDVQFGLQWDRRNRVLLPELVAVHLESEPSKLGANWNGRQTPQFGPHHRRHHHHHHRHPPS